MPKQPLVSYDPDADAVYLYVHGNPGEKVDKTEPIHEGLYLDYTDDGRLFGIEILDMSGLVGGFVDILENEIGQ